MCAVQDRSPGCRESRLWSSRLIGDAAGYVDAITGEGMTLAFASATELASGASEAIGG